MPTILEAKKHFQDRFRSEKGFVGVGLGRRDHEEALRLYVIEPNAPVIQKLPQDRRFEGFPIVIEVSGQIRT